MEDPYAPAGEGPILYVTESSLPCQTARLALAESLDVLRDQALQEIPPVRARNGDGRAAFERRGGENAVGKFAHEPDVDPHGL